MKPAKQKLLSLLLWRLTAPGVTFSSSAASLTLRCRAAVSKFLKAETVRDFQVPAERIEVIPNFVDRSIWHANKVCPDQA